MNNIETYQTNIQPALDILDIDLIHRRKALADKTKPNPVTKVAQRLAPVDEDGFIIGERVGEIVHNAGVTFLESIHVEIDNTDVNTVRARYVASNQTDALAGVFLSYLSRHDNDEADARHQDKKELAQTFA